MAVAIRPAEEALTPLQQKAGDRLTLRGRNAAAEINAFAEFALRDKDGRAWKQQPFHREWHALVPLQGPARVLIGAPREHAKSTQMSVARVIWELGRNPELRVKIVAAADSLATALVQEVSANIERNPRVGLAFPDLLPDWRRGWAKTQLFVQRKTLAKDASVEACSILSTGVGGRADLIMFDDVVDFRNAIAQPAAREQVKKAFREVWVNLLGPDGRAVYVATVWHQADLTCELRGSGDWRVWWRPAMDANTGEVLWPEKWSREALAAREREIGPRPYSRQFQLLPLSDDETTFPERVLAHCLDLGKAMAPGAADPPADWPRYIGVDLGASLGAKAAYTVAFVIARSPDGLRVPVAIERGRWQFDQVVEMVARLHERHRPTIIMVENNGYQDVMVQHLSKQYPGIPVQAHTTGRQKADERIGLPGLAATMANGGWIIPSGGDRHPGDCPCAWCAWVEELRGHPVAQYSDTVMAMWFADRAAAGAATGGTDWYRHWGDMVADRYDDEEEEE